MNRAAIPTRRAHKGRIFDQGTGPVVVVVPGLQGRWEWMLPALRKLAERCRVISYSLSGDLGSGRRPDTSVGFDVYIRQLDEVLEAAGVERATICGVSFGGLIAVRYAACRSARVDSLVLASAPAPGWQPSPQQAKWIARPWLSAPAFVASSPFRLWPEVRAARPRLSSRLRFFARQGLRAAASPMIPGLMARRIREVQQLDFGRDCASIDVPTLVVTGEEELDRVVPVRSTRRYQSLIRNARWEVMRHTGHIGVLTRPDRFAELVGGFVHARHH
jgi:pimeloyl-ACP methyl ester carboxylesterase